MIIGSAVAVGTTAIAVKKLFSNSELNAAVVENGKKVRDSVKDFGTSVHDVVKNAVDTVDVEVSAIKEEVNTKLKEKEPEIDAKVAATKQKVHEKAEKIKEDLEAKTAEQKEAEATEETTEEDQVQGTEDKE